MSNSIGATHAEKEMQSKHRRAEKRQIEISACLHGALALLLTLLLTGVIVSFAFVEPSRNNDFLLFPLRPSVLGLAGLVLLFDFYVAYQQLRIRRIRRRLNEQGEFFQLIGQYAADMIAVVDMSGRRLYNSPAYEKILGYSAQELQSTACFEQIHPDDRQRVISAAEEARTSGVGSVLQYRMRRKDGGWRTLESSASVVCDADGQPSKLVIVNRDITDRKSMEEQITQLRWAATHDSLTGLPNRLLCDDRLQGAIARAIRHDRHLALLCIDLDNFKLINDQDGHDAGDEVLKQLATRLQSGLRAADMVARFGGDEFIAIVEDIKCPEDVQRIATLLLATVSPPIIIDGNQWRMSISIGGAIFPTDGRTPDELKRNADYAMYRAKARGGNTCEMFSNQLQAGWEHSIESCLQKTVHGDGLELYYQPQYTVKGQLAGLEALLRLRDPQLQRIPPVEFIALAEQNGLIVPIGEWVLRESCRQAKAWQAEGFVPIRVAVNISTVQLACRDFAARVESILNETGMAPSLLQLEITESVLMADIEDSARSLRQLEHLGVRISIDDFGTGYSSLTYLHRLPVHSLKVDKSFVQQIDASTCSLPIISSIVTLGRTLGLEVVAEGVETERQSAALTEAGCDLLQGFLFSRPKPACSVRDLLLRADNLQAVCPAAITSIDRTAELGIASSG